MYLSADTMAFLFELGISGERLVELVRRLEADAVVSQPRTRGAERQARYRARKAEEKWGEEAISGDVTRDVTSDASPVTSQVSLSPSPPEPPSTSNPSSTPPIVPQRSTPSKAEIDGIWNSAPRPARERSSREDVKRALTAAMRRGHEPEAVKRGLLAAYASTSFSGDHAKGVHRLIENDRWQSFTEDVDGQAEARDPARDAEILARMRALAEARADANA